MNDSIRSITVRYYLVWAWYTLGPFIVFAIYPLFLRSRGLDQFEINVVSAVFVLMTFLTDLPTGAFADAAGRRAATVAGCVLHACAFLIYLLSHRYWQFMFAAAIDGLGTTFGNGPIDAWAIDALDGAGFEGAKDALFSRKFQLSQVVGMCAALAGAYVAQLDIAIPIALAAVVWIATGISAALMMTGGARPAQPKSAEQMLQEVRRRSIDSTRLGFADRNVRWLSVAGLLSALLWYGWGQEWQQYFNHSLRAGIARVGWVSVALIAAQVMGLEVAARMRVASENRASLIAAMTGFAAAAIIAAARTGSHVYLAVGAIMAATFAMGIAGPIGFAWFNEVIQGENRATLLSFSTTMSTLGGIIGLPAQGRLVDAFGISAAWQIAALVSMTQVFCYLALRPRPVARNSVESA